MCGIAPVKFFAFFCFLAFTPFIFGVEASSGKKASATYASPTSINNIDIDGNEKFDALTDGLLILRSTFEISGSSLIAGVLADDAVHTNADDIEGRIALLGNKLDIDDDGDVDALTDGLLVLRYLFEIREEALTLGVLSPDAKRTDASDIEAYLDQLTTLFTPVVEVDDPTFSNISISPNVVDVSSESKEVTITMNVSDVSGIDYIGPPFFEGGPRFSGSWELISGDIYNGTYRALITIPTTAPPANMRFSTNAFSDIWGNSISADVNDALEVVNDNAEEDDPTFSNISISPNVVDVSSESKEVTITMNVSDVSGIDYIGPPFFEGGPRFSGSWELISGDIYNGTYRALITIPTTAPPANMRFSTNAFSDIWGNSISADVNDALQVVNN